MSNSDFEAYKLLFIDKFDRLEGRAVSIENKLAMLHDDMLMLKTKAGIWGAVAGSIGGTLLGAFVGRLFH